MVVADIEEGRFGNAYTGSSLETVIGSIAEQRQVLKGADHPFLCKPKLRLQTSTRTGRSTRVQTLPAMAPPGRSSARAHPERVAIACSGFVHMAPCAGQNKLAVLNAREWHLRQR